MGNFAAQTTLLALASRAAGTTQFRLNAKRWRSTTIQARRSAGAPATLTVHLDGSSKSEPDVTVDTDWEDDIAPAIDLTAGTDPLTIERGIDEALHPWLRVRVEHTGGVATYELVSSGKGTHGI